MNKFRPMGGFPSIIRKDDMISEKTLETRGFGTTNIVSINNIMNSKKKENLFSAFGSEEEDGLDYNIANMVYNEPYEFKRIIE